MPLTVVVPPAQTAFSTLDTLREEIPAAATIALVSDARLMRLLAVSSAAISDVIGKVALATYQDRFQLQFRDGYVDARALPLSVRPIVQLVKVGDVALADIGDAIEIDAENGILRIVEPLALSDTSDETVPYADCDALGWWEYVSGLSYLEVQYQAGYVMPGQAGANLPPQLEQAAIESVRYLLAAPRDPSIRSEMVQGVGSTTYNAAFGTLPDHVMAMLDPFRATLI